MTGKDDLLPWQTQAWGLLQGYIKLARIPQALLVSGPRGVGKRRLAHMLANSLLCPQPDGDGFRCGHCQSCLLVNAESHPDFTTIKPEEDKKSISINQIRSLIVDSTLKPQYEQYRVIVIDPADLMTISAINAFLKSLEEPGDRTVYILITNKPHKLPATMLSRCQQIKLTFPDRRILTSLLGERSPTGQGGELVKLVTYSILTIDQLADSTLLQQRESSLKDWFSIALQEGYPTLVAEKWLKLPAVDLFNWLCSWVSDLIKCRLNCQDDKLCNQDMAKSFQHFANQLELPKLFKLSKLILDGRAQLGAQANQQLMLEEILIQWQQLNRSK